MARRKIPTTVYITPERERELKELHRHTRVPIAEYVRQGIDLILDRHKHHLPGQLDLGLQLVSDPPPQTEGLLKAAAEKRR